MLNYKPTKEEWERIGKDLRAGYEQLSQELDALRKPVAQCGLSVAELIKAANTLSGIARKIK